MPRATVIAAFYNKIDYLRLVLEGFERQSEKDFELIVADDGSKQEIVKELESLSKKISFPLIHIWQEDKGFRKNKILNKAITTAKSNYIIFIDADCIPHFRFVEEHISYSAKGSCLTGRRVNLSQKYTQILSPQKVREGLIEKNNFALIKDSLFGESFYVEKGFYFKSRLLRKIFNKKERGLLGCNFSLYKEDMLNINAFDERYEAPSIGEDSDVQFRLELNGIKIISLNHIAVQYHLYHQLLERPQENLSLFNKIREEKHAFTPFGIK
ncbi:MAG: glycosyltransferase [Ignavibacteriaceae bacterium]